MDNCIVEDTRSNKKTLKILKNDKYFYIHSKYDPEKEARDFVNNMNIKVDDIIVLVGNGLGHISLEIKNKMSEYNKLIVYETNKHIFECYKNTIGFETLLSGKNSDNIQILLLNDVSEIRNNLESLVESYNFDKINFKILQSYKNIWETKMTTCASEVKKYISDKIVESHTIKQNTSTWQKNMLCNIKHIFNSYDAIKLFSAFNNKPVIIVSAGPSLDKNVHLLKGIEDKVLIICVYTALRVLYKHGIKPHFVMAIDGNQPLYNDCYDDIPILYMPMISSDFLNNYSGKKIFMGSGMSLVTNLIFKDYLNPNLFIATGGSVACSATDLAVNLGANPIIFIGQDLSFTGETTHAKGTYTDESDENRFDISNGHLYDKMAESNKMINSRKYETTDIYGNKVYTDDMFSYFKNWFEAYMSDNKHKTKFINATEGGTLKKNVDVMDLKDVISKYIKEDINTNDIISNFFEKGKFINPNGKKEVLQKLIESKDSCIKCLSLIESALEYAYKLKKLFMYSDFPKPNSVTKILNELEKIDIEFNKVSEHIDIIGFNIFEISSNVSARIDDKDSQGMKVSKQNIALYEGLSNAINEVLPLLENSINEIQGES